MLSKITKEELVSRCQKKYGTKFSYEKLVLKGMKVLSVFTCLRHGDFSIWLEYFLRNRYGCLKCGMEKANDFKKMFHCRLCKKLLLIKDRWISLTGKHILYHVLCKRMYERKQSIEKTYNISFEQYLQMFSDQQNKCKICNKDLELYNNHTHCDHCHISGKVRGILCSNCNKMLGSAKDNIDILQQAINYLKESLD